MKYTATLKELMALVIQKGKVCICTALIFALLLGGVEASTKIAVLTSPENSPETVEKLNKEQAEIYNQELVLLQDNYRQLKNRLETAIDYEQNSLLCKIDPHNKVVAQSVLSITDIDENAVQTSGSKENSAELAILSYYHTLWESADLQKVFQSSAKDAYIREVIAVSVKGDTMLNIIAWGSSEDEAKAMINTAVEFLNEQTDMIGAAYYSHDLTVLSSSVKISTDYKADGSTPLQKARERILALEEQLAEAEQTLKDFKKPAEIRVLTVSDVVIGVLIQLVIGGVIGAIVGGIFVIVGYLLSNRLRHVTRAEQQFPNCFALCLSHPKNCFEKISAKIIGERIWSTQEQALAYLQQYLQTRYKGTQTVALVTTLSNADKYNEIAEITKTLEQCGYRVTVADNACYNSEANDVISKADVILMIEQYDTSKINEMEAVLSLVSCQEKAPDGFVTI